MLVCVKDRTYQKMAIPAYCFRIFGTVFGALFCLLIKKLILECDSIWQSMRDFYKQFEVSVHFLIWKKKKHFFLENCTLTEWYSLRFLYLFIKTWKFELKFSENLSPLTFLREKVQLFPSPNDICTPFES